MGLLEIEEHSNRIVEAQMNRPEKLNALNQSLLQELISFIRNSKQENTEILIIRGAGKAFSSGVDLDEIPEGGYVDLLQELTRRTADFPGIVIGNLDGYVVGGGFEFTLSFDLRYASTRTTIQMPESEIGATISNASTVLLPLHVGYGKAKELVLTGRKLDAEEAHRLGIVTDVQEPDVINEKVRSIAQDISKNQSQTALMLNKKGFSQQFPISDALEYERMVDLERQIMNQNISQDEI